MKVKNCHQEGQIHPQQCCAAATETCFPRANTVTSTPASVMSPETLRAAPPPLYCGTHFKNSFLMFFCFLSLHHPLFFCPSLLSPGYLNVEFPAFSLVSSCHVASSCSFPASSLNHTAVWGRNGLTLPPTVLWWVLQSSALPVWSRQQSSIHSVNFLSCSLPWEGFRKTQKLAFVCFIKFWI